MTMPARQIPFDLGFRSAQGRGDFIISPSNRDAVAWIDRWPNWGAPLLVLSGPAASGKSHLGAVWRAGAGALIVPPSDIAEKGIHAAMESDLPVLVDGADPWLGEALFEENLFHLYNVIKESGRSILLTTRMTPAQVDFAVPDLASRMRAAPCAMIQPPDDALLGAVLMKLFSDRQLNLTDEMVQYALPRMERSFAAARALAEKADAHSLSQKKPLSTAVLRLALAAQQDELLL